jgi:N-acetylneuraminic acid mutarotase
MPTARGSPAAAVLGGKIYVAGGWPTSRSKDFAVYDPAADSWQTLSDLPSGRNHLAVAAADGRIFAVGGRTDINAGVGNVATVDAFDPVGGSWSSAAALPRARGGLAAVGFDRWVFAFGGEGNVASVDGTFEDADLYDATANAWSALEDMPTPRHGIGAAIFNGRIHIPGGGPVENFSVTDVHEALHIAAAIGLPIPVMPAVGALILVCGIAAYARRTTAASRGSRV